MSVYARPGNHQTQLSVSQLVISQSKHSKLSAAVAASLMAARVPYIAVLPTTVHARPEHHHSQYSVSQSVSQQIPDTAAAAAATTTTMCSGCTWAAWTIVQQKRPQTTTSQSFE